MKISINERREFELEEVYNPIVLRTGAGYRLAVCMRDDTFEITLYGFEGTYGVNMETGTIKKLGCNPIVLARAVMRKALENEVLRQTYLANIAMLLHDDKRIRVLKSKLEKGQPSETRVEYLNRMAERLLNLIFGE